MWPLVTYFNYFEIVSTDCDLSNLVNQAHLRYVSVNTVSLYTINNGIIFTVPGFRYCNINLLYFNVT